jgi:hypothetical protein
MYPVRKVKVDLKDLFPEEEILVQPTSKNRKIVRTRREGVVLYHVYSDSGLCLMSTRDVERAVKRYNALYVVENEISEI